MTSAPDRQLLAFLGSGQLGDRFGTVSGQRLRPTRFFDVFAAGPLSGRSPHLSADFKPPSCRWPEEWNLPAGRTDRSRQKKKAAPDEHVIDKYRPKADVKL